MNYWNALMYFSANTYIHCTKLLEFTEKIIKYYHNPSKMTGRVLFSPAYENTSRKHSYKVCLNNPCR